MSSPLIGAVPSGTGSVDGAKADYESKLATNDDSLDEGETDDDQDKVQEDIIEADAVNTNLDE
jgi:hypothetical protein